MHRDYLLLQHLPAIRRARGGYLYTEKGERFIDLWMQNGELLNGHQSPTLLNVVKNSLSRTFIAQYPNIWHEKVLHHYIKHFQAKKIKITTISCDVHFDEPWHHNEDGYYLIRANHPIPTNITMGKVILSLHTYNIYLAFNDSLTLSKPADDILPAYLAQIALKMLPFFTETSSDLATTHTHLFTHHKHYFQWQHDSKEYELYFTQALEQKILLPPHHQATGLWLPALFSEKQNALITTLIT